MSNFCLKEPNSNILFDTENLRINANYEIEVFEDVYWVPVNQLGGTRYTNSMIKDMLILSPEQKQQKISTLYEAIQLYQASNFKGVVDNYHFEGWEFHKPGYHAVRTNEGCCASNSNWLSFLIHDKYEQMGFIQYSQKDSNGHILNYIFHNGWYYFIDMMMYRNDSLPYAGKETGTISGYKDGELIAGNFHKSRLPQSYVNYCLNKFREAPVLFSFSSQKEVISTGIKFRVNSSQLLNADYISEKGFDLLYSPLSNAIILYIEKDSKVKLKFEEPPICVPKWDEIPTESLFLRNI